MGAQELTGTCAGKRVRPARFGQRERAKEGTGYGMRPVISPLDLALAARRAAAPERRFPCGELEAAPGFEPGDKGFADPRLTTWLCRLNGLWGRDL